jgi:arsenate reductase (glutaredoxin)
MIVIEGHRFLSRFEVEASHCGEFVIILEYLVVEIFFGLVNRFEQKRLDCIGFVLGYIALGFGAAFVGIDHFLGNHHRKARKVIHEHLLNDNDVRNVPDQVVIESAWHFVELFQTVVFEEFGNNVAACFCDGKGVSHFKIFDKNKHFDWEMDFLCTRKLTQFMNVIYYLASCDTCRKIIKSLPENNLVFHDIRQNPISETELDQMHALTGSYEALFSRKAQLYKSMDLKNKALGEADFKRLILEHYTFLSRPVFIIDAKIYIGNSQKNIDAVIKALS